mgnify:CR=1 FL=1
MRRLVIVLLLGVLVAVQAAQAGLLPPPQRAEILKIVLPQFWGHARLPDGSVVEPVDEADRLAVPIDASLQDKAFSAAEISGLALWCGLPWEEHFKVLMANTRAGGAQPRQAAFVAVLHGFTMEFIKDLMAARACDDDRRKKTQVMLTRSTTLLQQK